MNEVIGKDSIENLIYEIRGKQVMLDSDLAKLYGCANGTKDINKAVKRNIERFPQGFMFQLTDAEYNHLRFQLGTSKVRGGRRYNPCVFTEQGVAMLSSVLHSKNAIKISVQIINAFVIMRKYMSNNFINQNYIQNMLIKHDNDIKLLQESFRKFDEKKVVNEIYFNGQIYDAYSKTQDICKGAKNELIIIDGYADNVVLDIVKRLDIRVIIITMKDNLLTNQDIMKYNKQYHNLKVIFNNSFHDRYFILDRTTIYHCGTSINRIGNKTFSVNLIGDEEVCNSLINVVDKII